MKISKQLLNRTVTLLNGSPSGSVANKHSCKLLVLGGGTAGCTIASKFVSKLGKNKVVIVEPTKDHYYQPMLTLIGGGMKELPEASRPMSEVLPKDALWINDRVARIDPESNTVLTVKGTKINYDYLVVAIGLELKYDEIPGLEEALSLPDSGVCSNYSPKYVNRTFEALKKTKNGNAIFTFPNSAVKCAGAPLKACLISEDYFRKEGIRDFINVYYRTSLPVIFSANHYAQKLVSLCNKRKIDVGLQQELVEITPHKKEATFRNRAKLMETTTMDYSMLHVTPPMAPPRELKLTKDLTDEAGYLKIDKQTLKHDTFKNIYGIGDCTNLPTSKTAAAVAAQSGVVYDNLSLDLDGEKGEYSKYDGYTSCPLVTGYKSCIMAEFDYNFEPLETFPIDQSCEQRSMFFMKKDVMPLLYWHAMLKGYWRGPKIVRKILHLGMGK